MINYKITLGDYALSQYFRDTRLARLSKLAVICSVLLNILLTVFVTEHLSFILYLANQSLVRVIKCFA
ncbi:hypothetical protein PUN28_010529 [Cardiocondyla obscurior]|uniref:Uncharacterized protein n=1 Tax=Cardiocondyla obscurior TaxID=286306 RepID=A0AAW2FGD5_9HYME